MAVPRQGKVTAFLPLPACGLLSAAPATVIARGLTALRPEAEIAADWLPPLRSFKSLVGAGPACNPGTHVTDLGIACGLTDEFGRRLQRS
jgi:adenine deaminase